MGGSAGPITAGLSAAESCPACGVGTALDQNEPTTAATSRHAAPAMPATLIGCTSTFGGVGNASRTRTAGRRSRTARRTRRTLGPRRPRGAASSTAITVGPTGSGPRIASWMEAESSPQKSSGRTGEEPTARGGGAPAS